MKIEMKKVRLVFLALLGDRAGQFHEFRHFEADFFFNDFG